MDIEELSKSQLILLMLLVNFITSIATGVLTVSLLDQTPENITQTVNQIVDRTIQTVATNTPLAAIVAPPTVISSTQAAPAPETTDQLLTSAIAGQAARSVSIYSMNGTTTAALAVGTYLPKARAVVTATISGLPTQVTIEFPDGSTESASLSHSGDTLTIYGFSDSATLPAAPAVSLADPSKLEQGQAVIALTGNGAAVTGIISKVTGDTDVLTTLPSVPAGYGAVDAEGDLIGISDGLPGDYFPADRIMTLLDATSTSP